MYDCLAWHPNIAEATLRIAAVDLADHAAGQCQAAHQIEDGIELRHFGKIISRPSLVELSSAVDRSSWASGSFTTYQLGNPNLKPTESIQWDASFVSDEYKDLSTTVSYEFGPHITAYVEGSNLLNNADFRFSTYRNVPAYYEAWCRAYFVGVRARL